MWTLEFPWWEYVLRSVVIYAAVFILLRVFGKKQLGELSPFDFVLLLIISEAVSNGITGGDQSLGAALIAVTSFILTNYALDFMAYKSKKFESIFDGKPQVLIKKGHVNEQVKSKEKITEEEILSALRAEGVKDVSKVDLAILEPNGKISVIER